MREVGISHKNTKILVDKYQSELNLVRLFVYNCRSLTCIMMIGVMLYLVSDSEMKAVYSFLWNCGALSFVSFRCITTEVALLLSPPKDHIKGVNC